MSAPAPEVVLVDFGMGNLRSVARALERAGAKPRVSVDPAEVLAADRVVVPGVGACGDALRALRRHGLDSALRERIAAGRPYLGICLGMHVLLEEAEEGPSHGLGIVTGTVARFPAALGLAIPHMGWNEVEVGASHPVLRGGYFYFVHAYRCVGLPDELVLATTEYGERFASGVGTDAWLAVQFHPEKSQYAGLELLERFCRWAP